MPVFVTSKDQNKLLTLALEETDDGVLLFCPDVVKGNIIKISNGGAIVIFGDLNPEFKFKKIRNWSGLKIENMEGFA